MDPYNPAWCSITVDSNSIRLGLAWSIFDQWHWHWQSAAIVNFRETWKSIILRSWRLHRFFPYYDRLADKLTLNNAMTMEIWKVWTKTSKKLADNRQCHCRRPRTLCRSRANQQQAESTLKKTGSIRPISAKGWRVASSTTHASLTTSIMHSFWRRRSNVLLNSDTCHLAAITNNERCSNGLGTIEPRPSNAC